MINLYPISRMREVRLYLLGDHNGPMVPAGEAERDGGIALACADILRQQVGRNAAADLRVEGREALEALALPDVDHQRGAANGRRVADELGEFRDQLDRQVVDGVISNVFERPDHGSLSGSAHPGNDDEL